MPANTSVTQRLLSKTRRHLSVDGLLTASFLVMASLLLFAAIEATVHVGSIFAESIQIRLSYWPLSLVVAIIILVLVGCLILLIGMARFVPWRRRPSFARLPPIASMISLSLMLASSPVGSLPIQAAWAAAVVAGVPFLGGWLQQKLRSRGREASELEAILREITGTHGFDALPELASDGDQLGRTDLFNSVVDLLKSWRESSLTIAIEGSWGIGKSTMLNALYAKMAAERRVVVFRAWHYREPDRLLEAYFHTVSDAVGADIRLKRQIRRLANQLAKIPKGVLPRLILELPSLAMKDELENARATLEATSHSRKAIILVDDLDRLDRDELQAAIRAIRLMSDLGGVCQVLAYDRSHLARQLGLSAEEARAYMGKVVSIEFPLSAPLDTLLLIMRQALQPLLARVTKEEAEELNTAFWAVQRRTLARAVATPRDVKRIAATVAVKWHGDRKSLNLRDLFLITLLQYIEPEIYSNIRDRPEIFTDVTMLSDPERLSHEEFWRDQGQAYLKQLSTQEGGDLPLQVVKELFPHLNRISSHDEVTALRERRIYHPELFDRYFHSYYSPNAVRVNELEALQEELGHRPAGSERSHWFLERLQEFDREGRSQDLFEKFYFFQTGAERLSDNPSLVGDVSVAIAQYAAHTPDDGGFFIRLSQRGLAFLVLSLVAGLEKEQQTGIVIQSIESTNAVPFAGELIFASLNPDERVLADGRRLDVDSERVRLTFRHRILALFPHNKSILKTTRGERAAIIWFLATDPVIRTRVLQELNDEPLLLPRLLELGAPRTGATPVPEGFSCKTLEEVFPNLKEVAKATENMPVDQWSTLIDRELVVQFRKQLDEETYQAGASISDI